VQRYRRTSTSRQKRRFVGVPSVGGSESQTGQANTAGGRLGVKRQKTGRAFWANRRWPRSTTQHVRAKRLDMYGDRFGCIGTLNATRSMYVLVAKQEAPYPGICLGSR
jgi:hypothetical protein